MKQRVLTAIVLLAVVVGVLFFDPTGWGGIGLALLALLLVTWEYARLTKASFILLAASGAIEFLPGGQFRSPAPFACALTLVGSGVLVWYQQRYQTVASADDTTVLEKLCNGFAGLWLLRAYWIGFLSLLLLKLPFPPILTAAIPIWAGDSAAIFAGKAFGKHKLAPSISPNKTWEGSIANLLAAVGAAAALGYFLKYPMDKMLLLGVSCGVIGQLGDLFESYLKRQAGVKDSGNLLPGHGGVYDRLDSLLMTAPFSYWILSSFLK